MNLFDEPQEDERGEGGGRDGAVNVLYRGCPPLESLDSRNRQTQNPVEHWN